MTTPTGPQAPEACDIPAEQDGAPYALTLGHLPAAALLTAACTGLMAVIFGLGLEPLVMSLALFTLLTVLVLATAPLPRDGMGTGNRVTLARIMLICLIGGIIAVPPEAVGDDLLWALVPIAAVAALLDALDGAIARATNSVSAFGARLDMEADALFILILSLLAWRLDKTGAWVIAIGAMRYAFLAGMAVWPTLRGELPASRRRQTICVVQVVALIVALAPIVPPLAASLLAGVALVLLAWSFAVDIAWLARLETAASTGEDAAER